MLEDPVVVEKLLEGVIPPFDKEEIGKLDLNWAISRLFPRVGQVTTTYIKFALKHFQSSNQVHTFTGGGARIFPHWARQGVEGMGHDPAYPS